MTEPRTRAGRDLLAREDLNSRSFSLITPKAILAVEDEQNAATSEALLGAWRRAEAELLGLHAVLRNTLNLLTYTVQNVNPEGHWCRFIDGSHDPTCSGMRHVIADARALLSGAKEPELLSTLRDWADDYARDGNRYTLLDHGYQHADKELAVLRALTREVEGEPR